MFWFGSRFWFWSPLAKPSLKGLFRPSVSTISCAGLIRPLSFSQWLIIFWTRPNWDLPTKVAAKKEKRKNCFDFLHWHKNWKLKEFSELYQCKIKFFQFSFCTEKKKCKEKLHSPPNWGRIPLKVMALLAPTFPCFPNTSLLTVTVWVPLVPWTFLIWDNSHSNMPKLLKISNLKVIE